MWGGMAQ
uniref:Uncharacterized protein n=1 Tax=Panagrolaimus sp. ES5 TaxID=591445 RepID=A0AC34GA51_9BILA